ncbi:hypothetical protein [Xenophilus sp.]|uniref:hypothetical protein n=1 Tax=Xenophilus sp. TaxID=1873499 RepID=UPI0037DC07CA
MRFGLHNVARGTRVYDVDSGEEVRRVLEVNTSANWVKVHAEPLTVTAKGTVAERRIRFRAIHPIFAGSPVPCLFHCYGRQS